MRAGVRVAGVAHTLSDFGVGTVDELVVEARELVGEPGHFHRLAARVCGRIGAQKSERFRGRGRKLGLRASDAPDKLRLIGLGEPHRVHAVRRVHNFPGRVIDNECFWGCKRLREREELRRRRKPQVVERAGPMLKVDEPLGTSVRLIQHDQSDHAERNQESGEHSERDQKLCLYPRGKARDSAHEGAERPHDLDSPFHWRM